ncbi:MAG: hypothetical protein RIS88_1133, partial [Pseudomonadota bacterium]
MTPVFHALRAAALSILLAWASVQVAAQAPEKLVIKSHTPQDYADV